MRALMIIFLFCSCKVSQPTILTKNKCDENAIEKYIKTCTPATQNIQEKNYYEIECRKEASRFYCADVRVLVIRGRDNICPDVPEKYKHYCE